MTRVALCLPCSLIWIGTALQHAAPRCSMRATGSRAMSPRLRLATRATASARGRVATASARRRVATRATAGEELLAAAAALRREASALEREITTDAPPPPEPAAPPPAPPPPAGVLADELVPWNGQVFADSIELAQAGGTTTRIPAEWRPWFKRGASVVFRRSLPLPLGLILEEAGGGAIAVAEAAPGGNGALADVRPGDVLRACTAVNSKIVYGNVVFPLDGANTVRRRSLVPCDMQAFETVMDALRSNAGGEADEEVLLVLERELPP